VRRAILFYAVQQSDLLRGDNPVVLCTPAILEMSG
jgi:hypothetical protein